jgi:hypothetical protein
MTTVLSSDVQFAVPAPVIVVWPATIIPLVSLIPLVHVNVPAGNVIVSPSWQFGELLIA